MAIEAGLGHQDADLSRVGAHGDKVPGAGPIVHRQRLGTAPSVASRCPRPILGQARRLHPDRASRRIWISGGILKEAPVSDRARHARAPLLGTARAACLLACLGFLSPPPARAQTVRGRVVAAVTETAIPGATIRLLDRDNRSVSMAIAGATGAFVLAAPVAAEYTVSVEHIGYARVSLGPVQIAMGQVSDLLLRMTMEVIPLNPINVEVDASVRKLERAGFYERRRLGLGNFFDRDDIEARQARSASDVLRRVAGLHLVSQGYFTDVQARGVGSIGGCRPAMYIDGALVSGPRRSVTSFNLEDMQAQDLEAIEVYAGGSTVPPQYTAGGNSMCGVILFWTRKPGL
ncbi:MAG: hypothetical protein EXR95_05435 [Gemmatimonadetes bacterium]|nr:hypothetical protein [Gemmatimonadota bacterium]